MSAVELLLLSTLYPTTRNTSVDPSAFVDPNVILPLSSQVNTGVSAVGTSVELSSAMVGSAVSMRTDGASKLAEGALEGTFEALVNAGAVVSVGARVSLGDGMTVGVNGRVTLGDGTAVGVGGKVTLAEGMVVGVGGEVTLGDGTAIGVGGKVMLVVEVGGKETLVEGINVETGDKVKLFGGVDGFPMTDMDMERDRERFRISLEASITSSKLTIQK